MQSRNRNEVYLKDEPRIYCGTYHRHKRELRDGKRICVRCGSVHRCDRPVSERFWKYVDKNGPTVNPSLGPCWIWTGATCCADRRGAFNFRGRNIHASKAAWIMTFGEVPDDDTYHGREVCHKCDVPKCVRPDHLYLGSHGDNMHDMVSRGRNATAKLSLDQVREIRRRDSESVEAIAREYGVSSITIKRVLNGTSWKACVS